MIEYSQLNHLHQTRRFMTLLISNAKPFLKLLCISGIISLIACDPGHHGTAFIDNQSSNELILRYETPYRDSTLRIPANTKLAVLEFGGIGEGQSYPGAWMEFRSVVLSPTDSSLVLKKSITEPENWEMINENSRRHSYKPILCWFSLLPEDLVPRYPKVDHKN